MGDRLGYQSAVATRVTEEIGPEGSVDPECFSLLPFAPLPNQVVAPEVQQVSVRLNTPHCSNKLEQ